MPACGPPSSLSPLKVTRSAPARSDSPGQRLVRQAVGGEVDQRAAAQVHCKRQAVPMRELRQLVLGDRRGEALDGVVAGVHLHQQRGLRPDRLLVVAQVSAVGGADLDQLHAGARHDVGHAEGAADLDQLAARDDDLAPLRQRVEGEQDRGCIVVHHGRRLRRRSAPAAILPPVRRGRRARRARGRTPDCTARPSPMATASMASSGMSARPRLVCSTVPVRLNTGRSLGRPAASSRPCRSRSIHASPGSHAASGAAPERMARRLSSISARTAAWTAARPYRWMSGGRHATAHDAIH